MKKLLSAAHKQLPKLFACRHFRDVFGKDQGGQIPHDIITYADDEVCEPTGQGIRLCLSMLADEAASLGLSATSREIRAAIKVCQTESRRQ